MATRGRTLNPQVVAAKRKEGDAKMAEGEKCLQTGFFKWKPNFEGASGEFQRAATAYINAGLKELAIQALKRTAFCYENMKLDFSVAKNLEKAADLSAELGQYQESAQLYENAASSYTTTEYTQKHAETLAKASSMWLKADNVEKAISVLEVALDVYEADDNEYLGIDSYFKLAGLYIANLHIDKCILLLKRLIEIFKKLQQPHNIFKCFLYHVILLLHVGKGKEAFDQLGEYGSEPGFVGSSDYSLGSQILDTIMDDNQPAWDALLKSQIHNIRDADFAKLLLKMKLMGSHNHPFRAALPTDIFEPEHLQLDSGDEFEIDSKVADLSLDTPDAENNNNVDYVADDDDDLL